MLCKIRTTLLKFIAMTVTCCKSDSIYLILKSLKYVAKQFTYTSMWGKYVTYIEHWGLQKGK